MRNILGIPDPDSKTQEYIVLNFTLKCIVSYFIKRS